MEGATGFRHDRGDEYVIVEYIRYAIDDSRADAFVTDYAEAATSLTASPHALAWDLARCVDDPTQFVLRIEWDSAEGHMQGFRRSTEFRNFFSHVRPYVNDILEMRHYEQTSVASNG
jgi:quinol monooxygenase YgiN